MIIMLKKLILGVSILLGVLSTSNVSYSASKNQNNGKSLLENERELGRLVDDFSVLADKKDAHSQMSLFTDNATVEIVHDGKVTLKLNGKKELEETFHKTLTSYDTVYHFNGQKVFDIRENKATGTVYCMTILIGKNDKGQVMKNTMGIRYNDEYVYENGKWLISKRTSNFDWRTSEEMK